MSTLSSLIGSKVLTHQQHATLDPMHDILEALERVCGVTSDRLVQKSRLSTAAPDVSCRNGPMPKSERVTPFHSLRVSPLSLPRLARILCANFNTTDELMLASIVLLVRYCETSGFRPSLHSMHRLLAACVAVTIKTHCDFFFSNEGAGQACGLCLEEVNRLEVELCTGTNWRLLVESHEARNTADLLQRVDNLCEASPRPHHSASLSLSSGSSPASNHHHHHHHRSESGNSHHMHSFNSVADDYVHGSSHSRAVRTCSASPRSRPHSPESLASE